ncbi:hypothetical protein V1477_000766 [Vespula maculifrons]|uniref:Uncharacterized protein n=1 Tax=Vespula maculifrons TaxID=7453 RepID=A0ABD2D2T0_VESMC
MEGRKLGYDTEQTERLERTNDGSASLREGKKKKKKRNTIRKVSLRASTKARQSVELQNLATRVSFCKHNYHGMLHDPETARKFSPLQNSMPNKTRISRGSWVKVTWPLSHSPQPFVIGIQQLVSFLPFFLATGNQRRSLSSRLTFEQGNTIESTLSDALFLPTLVSLIRR